MHPVKYTLDGTKYRGFVDLIWFVLKIVTVDGREFVGDAVSDSHDEPFLKDPEIELDILEGEHAGRRIGIKESRIRSIEVLERPEDDIGPFGPLPKDDDPYWDDDA